MVYVEKDDIDFHEVEFNRMWQAVSPLRPASPRPFKRALDIGGGGGMHSAFLTRIAERVICMDFADQNANYGGEFIKLLKEKFERNNAAFDSTRLEFHAGDAMDLVYRDGAFDLVVSFNAFEHIPDPARAAAEVVRVLSRGGIAYLTFDPLWACDSGSHFFHRVPRPWEHLLVSQDTFANEMQKTGAGDDEISDFRSAMNKVRLEKFRALFKKGLGGVKLVAYQEWRGVSDPAHMDHPNFLAARNLGYSEDDLLVRGISVILTREK